MANPSPVPTLRGQLTINCYNYHPPHLADENSELAEVASFATDSTARRWQGVGPNPRVGGPGCPSLCAAGPEASLCGPGSQGRGSRMKGAASVSSLSRGCPHSCACLAWGPASLAALQGRGQSLLSTEARRRAVPQTKLHGRFLRKAFPAVPATLPGGLLRVPCAALPRAPAEVRLPVRPWATWGQEV